MHAYQYIPRHGCLRTLRFYLLYSSLFSSLLRGKKGHWDYFILSYVFLWHFLFIINSICYYLFLMVMLIQLLLFFILIKKISIHLCMFGIFYLSNILLLLFNFNFNYKICIQTTYEVIFIQIYVCF